MGGVGYVELKVWEGFDWGRWASGPIVAMSERTGTQAYQIKMNSVIVSLAKENPEDFAREIK